MITESWIGNLVGGLLLALIATFAMAEAKSSSLVPKSLLLWPALLVVYGVINLVQTWQFSEIFLGVLGVVLILCGLQAALVNIRRLGPWPSGAVWLGFILAGLGFQLYPFFEHHLIGFIWMAIGLAKVTRERSAALETGTPLWISLLYVQAVLLASYR